jgi:predicted enzyme related to lactoylglutathione lyase
MDWSEEADMAGELSFFELGVEDAERGRVFYAGLFGWNLEPGPSGQGFTIGTPTVPGGLHGGDPRAAPYVFFRVADLNEALARVRDLGGTVEDMDVAGSDESIERFGRFKLCRDDQGSPFGLHQPPSAA